MAVCTIASFINVISALEVQYCKCAFVGFVPTNNFKATTRKPTVPNFHLFIGKICNLQTLHTVVFNLLFINEIRDTNSKRKTATDGYFHYKKHVLKYCYLLILLWNVKEYGQMALAWILTPTTTAATNNYFHNLLINHLVPLNTNHNLLSTHRLFIYYHKCQHCHSQEFETRKYLTFLSEITETINLLSKQLANNILLID